jgi:hypothetical protein
MDPLRNESGEVSGKVRARRQLTERVGRSWITPWVAAGSFRDFGY